MKFVKALLIVLLLVVLGGVAYLLAQFRSHGFSASAKPSRLEEVLARNARKIATPAGAREMKNPHPVTEASIAEAREHFVEHCSVCHGVDGRGATPIGRNLYPKAPDMTDSQTQNLSDGELFYIISNGVRFTGMPAWEAEHSPETTWRLVAFVRHLPQLSPEELKKLKALGSHVGAAPHEEGSESHSHGETRK